jgi:hypothetical protein
MSFDDDAAAARIVYLSEQPKARTMQLTNGLRFKAGELQQAWQCRETGELDWQPVPTVD